MSALSPRTRRSPIVAIALSLSLAATACTTGDRPQLVEAPAGSVELTERTVESTSPPISNAAPATTLSAPPTTVLPTTVPPTTVPLGPQRPVAPESPTELAALIVESERMIRDPSIDPSTLTDIAHRQQVAYRLLGSAPELDAEVFANLPDDLKPIVELNIASRRQFRGMHSDASLSSNVPAWEIISPAPAEDLLGFYRAAEDATGIEWEYLAAINLVETRMGRIRGLSTANAQGPMQFIPATWADWGEGDINNPADAIMAAGRYLDFRGGPEDMDKALWGYNNSDRYVAGVQAYAQVMRDDPRSFYGYYHWQVYFLTDQGTLWLPEGYLQTEAIPVPDYLANHPESAP